MSVIALLPLTAEAAGRPPRAETAVLAASIRGCATSFSPTTPKKAGAPASETPVQPGPSDDDPLVSARLVTEPTTAPADASAVAGAATPAANRISLAGSVVTSGALLFADDVVAIGGAALESASLSSSMDATIVVRHTVGKIGATDTTRLPKIGAEQAATGSTTSSPMTDRMRSVASIFGELAQIHLPSLPLFGADATPDGAPGSGSNGPNFSGAGPVAILSSPAALAIGPLSVSFVCQQTIPDGIAPAIDSPPG